MKTERQRINGLRWAVRAVLWLGILVSIAANVLHAYANPISQAIAAWPPVALFLTVELISRVPGTTRSRTAMRVAATGLIAGIAAWVSYWHMQGVAEKYGETAASAYLIPLTVDGLIVAASVCLVEIGARVTTLDATEAAAKAEAERKAAASEAAAIARAAKAAEVPAAPRPPVLVRPAATVKAVVAEAAAEAPHDDLTEARDRRLTSSLRAECLRQGRILSRAEAQAFLSVKTAHAGAIVKAVRESLGLRSHETTIPAEVVKRESV